MKPKSLILFLILFIGVFSSSMIGYLSGVRANRKQSTSPPVMAVQKQEIPDIFSVNNDMNSENVLKNFTETYVVRENEGHIGLFIRYANGDEQIHSDYDVSVNLLPKSDREKLEKGIELSNISDALQLVEDYMS